MSVLSGKVGDRRPLSRAVRPVAVVAVLDLPLRAYAMLDCDVLLMLGTDFPYRQFYPQGSGVRIPPVNW